MRIVFLANVLVAGVVGVWSLFQPESAARTVFESRASASPAMTITGAFWTCIAVLSAVGIIFPDPLAAVLLVQLGYKGLWLLCVALPAIVRGDGGELPMGIASFFLVWVIVIPFVYPWKKFMAPAG